MKRIVSTVLVLLMLTAIPCAVLAEGSTEATPPVASSLREIFRYDFEDGLYGELLPKASQVHEVREMGDGNKYFAFGLTSEWTNGTYLNMHAKDLSDDYLTDSTVSDAKQYYNSETFTVSASFTESDKAPVSSAYFEYKSAGKKVTCQLLHCTGNKVKTPGGTVLGQFTRGNWLNVTFSFNVKSGAIAYFVDGKLMASETLSKTADSISYFNVYIGGKEENASSELWLDNLSLTFGEVSEADSAYFEAAFRQSEPETPDDPGTSDPPESVDVYEIFRRSFDDAKVGASYRTQLCTIVADPVDAANSCMQIRSNGANDLFYHIDAKETQKYLLDPEADAKKDHYFNSEQIIISARYSRTEDALLPVTAQIKSTTVAGMINQKTLYTVDGSGNVKTLGGSVIGTLAVGKWLEVDVGLDLDKGTIVYYVDHVQAKVESFSFDYKISYFNLSQGIRDEGMVLLCDELAVAYGPLTVAYYEVPVEYVTSSGSETVRYTASTFTLPDTAPYWYGSVGGSRVLLAAGTELASVKGLSFTACEENPVLLDGASIRADYHTGLRFGATYGTAWYDALAEFFGPNALTVGVLIVPTDYLADGTAFTHEALSAKYSELADIVNRRWYSVQDGYSCYGTLSDLKAENYARSFSARAYLRIVDGLGKETVLYSDYVPEKHSRSAYEVAAAAFADTSASYTEAQRSAIRAYLDGTLALTLDGGVCTVADGPVGYTSPYTLVTADAASATVSVAAGTQLKTVTVNGSPVYDFTVSDGTVTVVLN